MNRLPVPLATLVSTTLAIAVAGCQATASSAGEPPQDVQRPVAELAVEVLAADLKVAKERITVESVTAIDWPNSSLGCPKPDMAYLDVITPGHKIVLKADDVAYSVHEANGRAFVCKQPQVKGEMVTSGTLPYGSQMLAAQKDLAGRLGVPVREIRPAGTEKRVWDDASLGCPEPGVVYAEVVTEGWVLKFRHGEREYTYHADANHAIPCPAIATQ